MARARGILLAGAVVLTTLIAHASAAGSLPGLGALALTGLVATALALAFAQRRRGWVAITVFALGTQLLLHGILVIGDHAVDHAGSSLLPSVPMLTGHAIAALVIAGVVVEADRVIGALARVLAATAPTLPTVRVPGRIAIDGPRRSMQSTSIHHVATRRGPPCGS